jgi:hypothetical protein
MSLLVGPGRRLTPETRPPHARQISGYRRAAPAPMASKAAPRVDGRETLKSQKS